MRIPAERKITTLLIRKKVLDNINEIEDGAEDLENQLNYEHDVFEARTYFAASRIQGLIRGFLARLYSEQLKIERKATVILQSLLRGKLGRKRWMYEYWKKISVVKSHEALSEILARSTLIRESDNKNKKKVIWREYFDPMTNSFWYFDPKTKLNTWTCPITFQKDLICMWEGFHEYGGLPSQNRCRCIFDNSTAYQNHLKNAHRWYCPACDSANSGLVFPVCSTCGNSLSDKGENVNDVVQKHELKLRMHLYSYMVKDHAEEKTGYNLKNRIIDKTINTRNQKRMNEIITKTIDKEVKLLTAPPPAPTLFPSLLTSKEVIEKASFSKTSSSIGSTTSAVELSNPETALTVFSDQENNSDVNYNSAIQKGTLLPSIENVTNSLQANALTSTSSTNQNQSSLANLNLNAKQGKAVKNAVELALKDFSNNTNLYSELDHEVRLGIIPPKEFDKILNSFDVYIEDKEDPEQDMASLASEEQTVYDLNNGIGSEKTSKLQVCKKFTRGYCKQGNTCPFAHQGQRDSAAVYYARIPGQIYKVPFVLVCENHSKGCCENGQNCDKYHIYYRPPTDVIIKNLYQKEVGNRYHKFPSGATIEGRVVNGMFNGYAVMTWPNGSTYAGEWVDNERCGVGIYRTPSGVEYYGQWLDGVRHGFGTLYHPNGEEYIGEFFNGKPEGVGKLTSAYGDIFEGELKAGKYEGIGSFTTKVNNKFTGYISNGMAHGLGIQVLLNGEKYKGYFEKNHRHGKGVCSYKNGSRYAGDWYRGVHEGFGVYVTVDGERYIGQWRASKKDGMGRYYFKNGDFYDGEFKSDKACGRGAYYSIDGNTYVGEWKNDKRNGRGTYMFANGSKYTGNWVDNNIHGKGKFDYSNGTYYRGEFDCNRKHGRGIFTWSNMNIYKGEYYYDEIRGQGELTYFKGHRYLGSWYGNKKNGYGIFYYAEGHIYDGYWKDDKRHGKGKIVYNPGSLIEESYEGDWDEDLKHGKGTYKYRADEGTVYEGDWVHGIRDGVGKISYRDGSYYRGDFRKEQMWGKGVYIDKSGSQYEGDWMNNMRHGIGTLMSSDGAIYKGEFWNNMKQGSGMQINTDGSRYYGVWDCGIIVGEGTRTIKCGHGPRGGPSEITVKVFSY